jgi:hypothetical protein
LVKLAVKETALNLPFTGADSRFYNPAREQMQAVAENQGIGFARGFHAESLRDLADSSTAFFGPHGCGSKCACRLKQVRLRA